MPSVTDHTNTMTERLTALSGRIAAASARAGHAAPATLVAVSKKQPAEAVRAARDAGQMAFGENYAQEGIAKRAALADDALSWHHIGPIQSNKCADIAGHFEWAQGVEHAHEHTDAAAVARGGREGKAGTHGGATAVPRWRFTPTSEGVRSSSS